VLPAEKYRVVRERAAIVDRSARGKIVVAGHDRAKYLHAMLTNDIVALKAGTGCYAAYLTPNGRMIADVCVYELGDVCLLDLHPSVKGAVLGELDRFVFSEDVRLGDVTETFGCFGVYGPMAAHVLVDALGGSERGAVPPAVELGALAPFQNRRAQFSGESAIIVAAGRSGAVGFEIYIERRHAGDLGHALERAGGVPVDDAVMDAVRIEAGIPAFTIDMGQETIPLEAGIERDAISFTKGCYPGQEIIIRIVHRGHGRVAKKLVGLLVQGEDVPDPGDRLFSEDREVGRVTSAAYSPALLSPIALGYVERELQAPGTPLALAHRDARLQAVVGALPFVAPSR